MGMTKEAVLNGLARQDFAEEIAVEAGVLIRCKWHEYAYQEDWDYTAAYTLGKRKYLRGELSGVFHSRREVTAEIKDVVDHAPVACPRCAFLGMG